MTWCVKLIVIASVMWLTHFSGAQNPPQGIQLFGPEFLLSSKELQKLHDDLEIAFHAGNYAEAYRLGERALKIARDAREQNPKDIANILTSLGQIRAQQGKFQDASNLLTEAVQVAETALGKNHPVGATALGALGLVTEENGTFSEALSLQMKALAAAEASSGTNSLVATAILHNIGRIYALQGNYSSALESFQRSCAILEKEIGAGHYVFAQSLRLLAEVHTQMGNFPKARMLLERVLDITRKALGQNHPEVAQTLVCIAWLDRDEGDNAGALQKLNAALVMLQEFHGTNHPSIAICLDSLAEIYETLGDLNRALSLYDQSYSIKAQHYGKDHPLVARTLENITPIYTAQGKYEQALNMLFTCLQIRLQAFGNRSPLVANTVEQIGSVYLMNKDFTNALTSFTGATALREKILGDKHPEVAVGFAHIADFWDKFGRYDLSAENSEKALRILEQAHGPENPDTIRTKMNLAFALGRKGDPVKCIASYSLAFRDQRRYLSGQLLSTPDYLALRLVARSRSELQILHSACSAAVGNGFGEAKHQAAETLALHKALFEELLTLRSRFSAELKNSGDIIHYTRNAVRENDVALHGIATNLPSQAALMDLLEYSRFDFESKENQWKEIRYAAYVTLPPERDRTNFVVRYIDLGHSEPINGAVETVSRRMASGQFRARDLVPALQRLGELIYAPLATHLTNVSHLIICPDGQLSRIPFEMLPLPPFGGQPRYLAEEKMITYVTSGREVARLAQPSNSQKTNAPVILGNPDFNFNLTTEAAPGSIVSQTNHTIDTLALPSERTRAISRSYRGFSFKPLPGSKEEAESVAKILGKDAVLLLGKEAREATLKKVVSPRVLHLATHGFFLTDQEFKRTNQTSGEFLTASLSSSGSSPPRFRTHPEDDWENPMIRCGIALAGANHASAITNSATEDGLLTGLEASLLNLQGTKLVILSACQTGVGDIKIGEGVMSLRRAFRIAGAETVLASHWPVSDKATSQLMTEFMRRWNSGEPRGQAWREAQLSLLRSKDFSHPYFWAAFTLTGQWR